MAVGSGNLDFGGTKHASLPFVSGAVNLEHGAFRGPERLFDVHGVHSIGIEGMSLTWNLTHFQTLEGFVDALDAQSSASSERFRSFDRIGGRAALTLHELLPLAPFGESIRGFLGQSSLRALGVHVRRGQSSLQPVPQVDQDLDGIFVGA